ncbi:hypothetical protein BDP27DRAFT_1180184, partial [Rhodocollybia butyracea]
MSHRWALNAFVVLSNRAMTKTRSLFGTRVSNIGHDNLNVPIRVFSQRLHNQSHFVSATAWTVWFLPKHEYLCIHSNTLFDLDPIIFGEPQKDEQIFNQNVDIVLRILLDCPEFAEYSERHKDNPAFAPPSPVFQLDTGPDSIVEGYIDLVMASYNGTLKVVMFILCLLCLQSVEEQQTTGLKRFIVWLGDQLTADRLRGLWRQRHEDHNSFDRLDWMVPLFGWFHLIMAFANSLYKQYLGSSAVIGSLKHAFDVLK